MARSRIIPFNLPPFIHKRSFWQTVFGIVFLTFLVYFLKNEKLEVSHIAQEISNARIIPVLIGFLLFIVYILQQAALYKYSFKSIGQDLDITTAIRLFLKRNLVSIFIPAGTFSSLAFFNNELENKGISKINSYYGSYLFALASLMSVLFIFIPGLVFLLLRGEVRSIELSGLVILFILVLFLSWAILSIARGGWVYRYIRARKPEWAAIIDEIKDQDFHLAEFVKAFIISMTIELVGVIHFYISMAAIGVDPSIGASFTGYVVMIVILSISPFLRGLGAIELTLTYTLTRYGYDTVEAASITLLFRFFEFWLPFLAGFFSFFKKENLLVRLIPSGLIFFTGLISIISALTPAIPSRLRLIGEVLPNELLEASNYSIIFFGILLMIISGYLFIGVKNAWRLGIILLTVSIFNHLIKAIDYEEALFATVALIALIVTRKSYFIKNDVETRKRSLIRLALVFGGLLIYAFFGFYFLKQKPWGIEFDIIGSLQAMLKVLVLFDTTSLHPHSMIARYFLLSLYISFAGFLIYAVYIFMKPTIKKEALEHDDLAISESFVHQFSRSSLDYFKIYGDKYLFINKNRTAFLAYQLTKYYAVVLELPVGKNKQAVRQIIREFDNYCLNEGIKNFYYRVPGSALHFFHKRKKLLIGQEAILNLSNFSLDGREKKSIRNAIHKVENSGYHFKIYEPEIPGGVLQKLEQVSNEWLHCMMREEVGFSQGYFHKEKIKECIIFTVEDKGEKIIAFTNGIPVFNNYSEVTYDLLRKSSDAPNGVMDFLLVNMFEYYKSRKFEKINMGLAPLAGISKPSNLSERTLKFVRENLRSLERFRGLFEYKDKFDPEWMSNYLIYDTTYDLIRFPNVLNKISKVS